MLNDLKVLLVGTDPDSNTQRIYTLHDETIVRRIAEAVAREYPSVVPFQIGHLHARGTEQESEAFRAAVEPYLADVTSAGPDWVPDTPHRLATSAPASEPDRTAPDEA